MKMKNVLQKFTFRSSCYILLFSTLIILGLPSLLLAQVTLIENIGDLGDAFSEAQPGDTLILKDGMYADIGTPSIFRDGTATDNIVFRPETPGGVVFTGESSFFITADYWHINGFEFREARSAPNEFLIPINMNDANHNRISQCAFINSGTQVAILPIIRLKNNCNNNRIDHNRFENYYAQGIQIRIDGEDDKSTGTLVDHNHFLDAKRNVTNGGEPIQIGGNAFLYGQIAANTIVEYNLFERADGDFEIISVKSSGNTIRYNKFIECDGALWLRGGQNNEVHGNYFKDNRGGMVLLGNNQKVYNNYIENGRTGISILYGTRYANFDNPNVVNSNGGQSFQALENSIVAHNTIVNTEIKGFGYGDNQNSSIGGVLADRSPRNNIISNNLVFGNSGTLFFNDATNETTFEGNGVEAIGGASVGNLVIGVSEMNLNLQLTDGIYKLQSPSDAIDAAFPIAGLTVDVDLDGQSRLVADIGADELSTDPIVRDFINGFDLGRQAQTISFDPIVDKLTIDNPFTLSATASSGLDVTYMVVSGPATVLGNVVTLNKIQGTVVVKASQGGNVFFAEAEEVEQTFQVLPPPSNCGITAISSSGTFTTGFSPENTTDGNLSTYWAEEGSTGDKWIEYELACMAVLTEMEIAFHQGDSRVYTFDLEVSKDGVNYTTVLNQGQSAGNSTGLETFTVIPTLGKFIRFTGFGNSINSWNEVSEVQLNLLKAEQSISFDEQISVKASIAAPFTVSATATSGLAVTYSIESGPATINGNLITLTGDIGEVVVKASQAGDDVYTPALDALMAFDVTHIFTQPDSASGRLVIEAEHHHKNIPSEDHAFELEILPDGFFGAGGMGTTPNNGTTFLTLNDVANAPRLDYTINFTKTGTHYIWLRMDGRGSFGDDSFHAGLDQVITSSSETISLTSTTRNTAVNGWAWNNLTIEDQVVSIDVPSTGIHTFNIWMREDGTRLDRIIITTDPNYVPDDTEAFDLDQRQTQTITLSGIEDKVGGESSFDVTATASSGLPVQVDIEGPASIDGNTVTLTGGTGIVKITATQAGDPNTYLPAIQVEEFNVGAGFVQGDTPEGLVVIEAEHYHENIAVASDTFVLESSPEGYSAAGAMVALPNNGTAVTDITNIATAPRLDYNIKFKKTGTHYIILRMNSGDNSGDNSFHAGLNGEITTQSDNFGVNGAGWLWTTTTASRVEVPSTGVHTLNIWMREDGARVDRIIVTTDPNYVPTGSEEAFSDGRLEQTITFTGLQPRHISDDPFDLTAVSSSGAPVDLSISGSASLSGNTVTLNGTPGTVEVTAFVEGNLTSFLPLNLKTSFEVLEYVMEQDTNGLVVLEAEHYHGNITVGEDTFLLEAVPTGYSGAGAMVALPDNGSIVSSYLDVANAPRLDYNIKFEQAGTHYIILRMSSGGSNSNDSFHAGLNGNITTLSDNFGISSTDWAWTSTTASRVEVPSAGIHTLNIWMREDGARLDKIILTPNEEYIPNDNETVTLDGRPSQTITLSGIEDRLGGEPAFDISATASSGLPVALAITGPASIDGNTITLTGGTGTVQVIAIQAGDPNGYLPAAQVESFNVIAGFVQDEGSQGLVVLEAEHYSDNIAVGDHTFVFDATPAGYFGTGAIVTTPNDGFAVAEYTNVTNAPRVDYTIKFVKTGTHYVWLRMSSLGSNGDDSFHVGIDGASSPTSDKVFKNTTDWAWTNVTSGGPAANIEVDTLGVHTLNIWMREDGARLDRIIVTTDPAYVPTDSETAFGDGRVVQTITFTGLQNRLVGECPFGLSASASSGSPVVLSITGPASLENGFVTLGDTSGTVQVNAFVLGNSLAYLPTEVTQEFSLLVSAISQDNTAEGLVVLEAEAFNANIAVGGSVFELDASVAGYSGTGAMAVLPDNGITVANRLDVANAPRLDYNIKFEQTGTHYIILRMNSGNSNGSDSFHAGLNEEITAQSDNFGVNSSDWQWTSTGASRVEVPSTGLHTLNIWMREDGARLDKIIITTDPSYIPTNLEDLSGTAVGACDIASLSLTSVCSEDPVVERRWRVRNPNAFPVDYEWESYGTSTQGSGKALPGDSFFLTPTIGGANTTVLKWQNGDGVWQQKSKASSGESCSSSARVASDLEVGKTSLQAIIYPNPAKYEFTVQSTSKGTVEIHSLQGVRVFKGDIDEVKVIDISKFHSGLYLVQITDEEGVTVKRLLIE